MKPHKSDATRGSLLLRLKDWEDHASWQTFFNTYSGLIHGQAISAGLTEVEAQEVVQDTLIEVSHRIKNFRYNAQNGSFRGWLFQLTRWRIANQFKKRPQGIVPLDLVAVDGDEWNDPSLLVETNPTWERDWREAMLDTALDNLRLKLPPKHVQVFVALVKHNWPVARVARCLKINRVNVYVVKVRVMMRVKEEIARLEKGENIPVRNRV